MLNGVCILAGSGEAGFGRGLAHAAPPACAPSAKPTSCDSEFGVHKNRRARIIGTPDRVEVLFEVIARKRFHEHPDTVGRQRAADGFSGAQRNQSDQSCSVRVFEQRAAYAWPPPIEVPAAWRVELASLSVEQALPFATGDKVVAAFMKIYERIMRA
jgi:uncharacterized protein YbdZ (MbtH family)